MQKQTLRSQGGFTMVELMMSVAIAGIISMVAFGFFSSTFNQYIKLSSDSENLSEVASQTQRIARVLRGLTDIVSATDNELTVYAYFSPIDQYVSQVRYYKNVAGTVLYADVTPMTSNPPIGTPITASKKTYTIISKYTTVSGTNLFTYLDSAGSQLTTPISDQHTIKGIKISLATPTTVGGTSTSYTTSALQVSLRNRKTNL